MLSVDSRPRGHIVVRLGDIINHVKSMKHKKIRLLSRVHNTPGLATYGFFVMSCALHVSGLCVKTGASTIEWSTHGGLVDTSMCAHSQSNTNASSSNTTLKTPGSDPYTSCVTPPLVNLCCNIFRYPMVFWTLNQMLTLHCTLDELAILDIYFEVLQ